MLPGTHWGLNSDQRQSLLLLGGKCIMNRFQMKTYRLLVGLRVGTTTEKASPGSHFQQEGPGVDDKCQRRRLKRRTLISFTQQTSILCVHCDRYQATNFVSIGQKNKRTRREGSCGCRSNFLSVQDTKLKSSPKKPLPLAICTEKGGWMRWTILLPSPTRSANLAKRVPA